MTTVTISLPDVQERERQLDLQHLLVEGLAVGVDIPLNEQFWNDLRGQAILAVKEHNVAQ